MGWLMVKKYHLSQKWGEFWGCFYSIILVLLTLECIQFPPKYSLRWFSKDISDSGVVLWSVPRMCQWPLQKTMCQYLKTPETLSIKQLNWYPFDWNPQTVSAWQVPIGAALQPDLVSLPNLPFILNHSYLHLPKVLKSNHFCSLIANDYASNSIAF